MHFVPTDWQILPQVLLQIDGIETSLLLDSGATTSCVNKTDFINDECTEGSSMGVNGTTVIHKVTAPLPVCTLTGELVTRMSFAVLLECPVCLLGRDLMAALQISLVFDKKGRLTATSVKCDLTNPKRRDMDGFFLSLPMSLEDHPIWAKCKDSVGLINCEPYCPCLKEGVMPVFQRQYPLSEEKLAGIKPQIEKYLEMGILREVVSPWNTPINPVKKANGTWRLVQDLRKVNKAIIPLPPLVADITTVFGAIPAGSKYYTVIDLSNAFFSIPVAWDAQSLFAFQWAKGQVTWTRLPQGFGDSPAAFSIVLQATLEDWEPKEGSTLIQYADDLLLSNPELEACEIDSRSLLDHLASKGHLASKKKIQYASTQVEYLGCIIEAGERKVSPARVKAVTSLSRPMDKATMLSFLGSIVYCRQWIPDCSHWDSILRKTTLAKAPKIVEWTEDRVEAFERLIQSLTQAPALALPDYEKPFQLYCVVSGGTYAAVLTQRHGGKNRPVSYLSKQLPPVVLGMPYCLQALAAAAMSVKDATRILHGNVMELFTTHTVLSLLQNMTTQHMTAQRLSGYETILLSTANLLIKTCPDTSPVIRLLHTLLRLKCEGSTEQVDPTPEHKCDEMILSCTAPRKDLKDTPQTDSIDVFVDGSCTRPDDKTYQTGYAVVMLPNQVIEAEPIVATSAQQAELVALTRACEIFAGHKVNIYTDSRYAYGTVHDYGLIWKNRGYISADGKKVANRKYIDHLLYALQLPEAISVVKVEGHSARGDYQAMGNNLADRKAKEAARRDTKRENRLLFMTDFESEDWVSVVHQLQKQSTSEDIKHWESQGLQATGTGLWTKDRILGVPAAAAPLLISYLHGPGHLGKCYISEHYKSLFCTQQLQGLIDELVDSCMTCAQNNVQGKAHGRHGNLPPPTGPLQDLQMDYTHMPRQPGNIKYLLVIVCRFSGWCAAIPTSGETAGVTARALVNHWISLYGLPRVIHSDQGPAFQSKLVQELTKILGFQWKLNIAYHPQSAGVVERMNRTIKDRLKKATSGTLRDWLKFLPAILYQIRTTPNKRTGLSPYEVLFGCPPNAREGADTESNIFALQEQYVKHLVGILSENHEKVAVTFPPLSTDPTHPFLPGDKVLVKQLAARHKTGPIFQGPFEVLRVARTAVLTDQSPQWIHACRLKAAPERISKDSQR